MGKVIGGRLDEEGSFIRQGPTDWRLQEGSHDGIGFAIAILIRPDRTSKAGTAERTDQIDTYTTSSETVVMSLGSTAELGRCHRALLLALRRFLTALGYFGAAIGNIVIVV